MVERERNYITVSLEDNGEDTESTCGMIYTPRPKIKKQMYMYMSKVNKKQMASAGKCMKRLQ